MASDYRRCRFIESRPRAGWEFVERWGKHQSKDLRMAIATCILEHLLDHHFDLFFPRIEGLARSNRFFAEMVGGCWLFGDLEHAARLHRLVAELRV